MKRSVSRLRSRSASGRLRGADVVAGHGEEEGVGEQEVGVGDGAQEVVADAEAEVEAVEAVFREHGEVMRPHLAVVEPGLVFDLAGEEALDAADGVGGPLRGRLRQGGRAGQGAGGEEKVAAVHNRIVLLRGALASTPKNFANINRA